MTPIALTNHSRGTPVCVNPEAIGCMCDTNRYTRTHMLTQS